jgi:membrane dipeptidase
MPRTCPRTFRTIVATFSFPLIFICLQTSTVRAEDPALEHARRLLAHHPVFDGHNDLPWKIRETTGGLGDLAAYDLSRPTEGDTDLKRLRAGGVGGQFWSVYVPANLGTGWARYQLEQIDLARRMIARYPDHLVLATSADEAERIMSEGRIASFLGIEGGHVIENSLGALRAYYALGARYMTLTHSAALDWADSSEEQHHGGLTRFGEEVVREMNRLGMLVDLSHTSTETMEDVLRVAEAPVIFSHSSARALCDHPRNVPDAVLRRLPDKGGVVMVTFVAAFISPEYGAASRPLWRELEERTRGVSDPAERQRVWREIKARLPPIHVTLGEVADHVEHVRRVAGIDHVGLGGDYDGNDSWPEGLEDVSRYPYLFAELIRRGWSDADLAKLASGNILRVMKEAEAVAARLRRERPASTATIDELDGRSPDPGP